MNSNLLLHCVFHFSESLKSIFRPISLMKPDLEYVACTELMCIGFKSAMSLGSKINIILYLCKRQFVPEKSQHLGIRTIKTILEYCQRLKIKNTQTEDQIVVVAVKNALKGVLNNKESNMLDVSCSEFVHSRICFKV